MVDSGYAVAPEQSAALAQRILELSHEFDIEADNGVEALVGMIGRLVDVPNAKFEVPPEYVREVEGKAVPVNAEPVRSNHGFFDVIQARASRRDFSTQPLSLPLLASLLYWTVSVRAHWIGYDFRDAPLRHVASAGGLASVDAYVVASRVDELEPGSYYYDYRRGLVPLFSGRMIHKIAEMNDQAWVEEAAAVVVFVGNCERVAHKYGPMGFKLMLLDAGVASGQSELVATALELRATQLGGLPSGEMARLLQVDGIRRVPLVGLAVGTRPHHG